MLQYVTRLSAKSVLSDDYDFDQDEIITNDADSAKF